MVVAASVGASLLMVQATAWALWADGSSASANYSSASLAPPSNPAIAAGVCVPLFSDQLVVSWAATASTWADGYEVASSETSSGPYAVVGTVPGRATTVFTNTSLAFSTTYFYVVRATKGNWRSAYTVQASRTTRSFLCL